MNPPSMPLRARLLSMVPSWLLRMVRSRLGVRFSRYTAASAVAVTISYTVFVLVYGPLGASPRSAATASIAGFVAGLVPKYALCRIWAWGRRDRSSVVREIIPYLAVSIFGALFAMYLTEFLENYVRWIATGWLQVFLVGTAFLFSQGLFFVVKFVLFDQVVFSDRRWPLPPRKRHRGDRRPAPAEL